MTLCDLLGEHGTKIPLVAKGLAHVGWQCCGCGAIAGLDEIFAPPDGLRCATCGGELANSDAQRPGAVWENDRGFSFCSRACWREPVKA